MTAPLATGDVAAVARPRRPIGVSIVAALSALQAMLLLLGGAAFLLASGDGEVQEALESGRAAVVTVGAVFAVLGGAELILAVLLVRGSEVARTVFGILNSIHVGIATYALAALRELALESVVALALPVTVLWLLYGSAGAREFFDR